MLRKEKKKTGNLWSLGLINKRIGKKDGQYGMIMLK
jgi:hypothetical protein